MRSRLSILTTSLVATTASKHSCTRGVPIRADDAALFTRSGRHAEALARALMPTVHTRIEEARLHERSFRDRDERAHRVLVLAIRGSVSAVGGTCACVACGVLFLRLMEIPRNVDDLLLRGEALVDEQQALLELLFQYALAWNL